MVHVDPPDYLAQSEQRPAVYVCEVDLLGGHFCKVDIGVLLPLQLEQNGLVYLVLLLKNLVDVNDVALCFQISQKLRPLVISSVLFQYFEKRLEAQSRREYSE